MNPKLDMAFASSISTPLVVEIFDRARLVSKKNPFKSVEDDSEGVFYSVSYDVLHNEDIRDTFIVIFKKLAM